MLGFTKVAKDSKRHGQRRKPGERRGGREKGTPNKRTQKREEQMAAASAALEQALANPFTGDSHALLMAIYKTATCRSRLGWMLLGGHWLREAAPSCY